MAVVDADGDAARADRRDAEAYGTAERHLAAVLAGMAGPGAVPRPDQVEAVAALVGGRRVLLVQATGWGKSAAYWAATAARGGGGARPPQGIEARATAPPWSSRRCWR